MRQVPPRFGIDTNGFPNGYPSGGFSFVGRYLSNDGFDRNLTRDEAIHWKEQNVDIVTVWENSKPRYVLNGYDQGRKDAKAARSLQRACGGEEQPIGFTVDFKPTISQLPAIADYFDGVNDVISVKRVLGYGKDYVLSYLRQRGLITYLWQTQYNFQYPKDAYDKKLPGAHIWQYENTFITPDNNPYMGKDYVCLDHAYSYDFGQWRPKI